uniref:Ubiquitin carboxyl-terminal hydrolase MINDY n=1 Tax=Spermophilus dauricus TaxID=99837 RepID=A0A8C9PXD0_SPEDA
MLDALALATVTGTLQLLFLGLKKTCVIMDQERPRSDLSINSRNDLRKVLHLEFLYRENKAKENPLKTNLELMTRYFLDHSGKTDNNLTQETPIPALSVPKKINKLPLRCSETKLVNIYDLSDEDAGWRTSLTETGKARHDNLDGDVLGHLVSSKRPHHKSKPVHLVAGESPALVSAWERMDKLHSSESSVDMKRTGEKTRPKSGLIVRGMMAGPVASSAQDPLRKRSLRRSPAPSSKTHSQEEESEKVPELSTHTPASAASQNNSASSRGSVSRSPRGPPREPSVEKCKATPSSPPQTPRAGLSHWDKTRPRGLSEDSPAENGPIGPIEEEKSPMRLYLPGGFSRVTQERLERAFKRQSSQPPLLRKNQPLASDKVDDDLGALQLEDVDDTSIKEEVILSPAPSVLKLQVASKPIDLSVAKEIKTLLFGSCFCCFNEEWKLQSFSFSDTASLKYGIVQNKGGPCGVLAAVQGCVLQKLLVHSDTHRTRCLTLAIADILWRAGGRQRAVVALSSGSEQFSPTGKYKADGVLETVRLSGKLSPKLWLCLGTVSFPISKSSPSWGCPAGALPRGLPSLGSLNLMR